MKILTFFRDLVLVVITLVIIMPVLFLYRAIRGKPWGDE